MSTNDLCKEIIDELVGWPGIATQLQIGGLEAGAVPKIYTALERWGHQDEQSREKVLVREYKKIDFAFVTPGQDSECNSLSVGRIFEVKFNYASQTGEIMKRVCGASAQLNGYLGTLKNNKQKCGTAHIIYIIAAPCGSLKYPDDSMADPGARYWRRSCENIEKAIKVLEDSAKKCELIIEASCLMKTGPHALHCAVLTQA